MTNFLSWTSMNDGDVDDLTQLAMIHKILKYTKIKNK